MCEIGQFNTCYNERFSQNFDDKITPQNYLIQQTVLDGDRQLSLIDGINIKLIMTDLPKPFEELKDNINFNKACKFVIDKKKEAGEKTLARSKSSQHIQLTGDIVEENSPSQHEYSDEKQPDIKKMNANEKRNAFKNSKLGKTQYLNYNYQKDSFAQARSDGQSCVISSSELSTDLVIKTAKLEQANSNSITDSNSCLPKLQKSKKSKSMRHVKTDA